MVDATVSVLIATILHLLIGIRSQLSTDDSVRILLQLVDHRD